ncbi:hypothetical protein JCM10207_009187 [Rhodosporidiobolus poonsookiae]
MLAHRLERYSPAYLPFMLQIHLARVSQCFPDGPDERTLMPHASLSPLLALVDETTRADVAKFRFVGDARRCLLGRLLVRYVLTARLGSPWSSFSFARTDRGRPYALQAETPAPLDFNLSHDSDMVVVASVASSETAAGRAGVDVMRIRNPWEGSTVEEFVEGVGEMLHPTERAFLAALPTSPARLRHALALWTLKEAFTKATGEGFHFDLERLSFDLDLSDRSLEAAHIAEVDGEPLTGWRFSLAELPDGRGGDAYWLAIAVQDQDGAGAVQMGSEGFASVTEVAEEELVRVARGGTSTADSEER